MNKTYESAKKISIQLQNDNSQIKICHLNDFPLIYHLEQAGIDNSNQPLNTIYASCYGRTSSLTRDYVNEVAHKFGFEVTGYEDDGFATNFKIIKDEISIDFNFGNGEELKEKDTKKYRQMPDGLWLATIAFILADSMVGWVNGTDECTQPILTILDNFSFNLGEVMDLYYDDIEVLMKAIKDEHPFYPTFTEKVRKAKKYENWTWNPQIQDWETLSATTR